MFGSGGMVTAGDGRSTDMTYYGPAGLSADTSRADTDLLHSAYVGEFQAFVASIRGENADIPTGEDGFNALAIACAAIVSVQENRSVAVEEVTR